MRPGFLNVVMAWRQAGTGIGSSRDGLHVMLCTHAVCHSPFTGCERAGAGIGNTRDGLHPVQERLARAHGSQCGFCTPGFVMSMYALLRSRSDAPSEEDIEENLAGNLWCVSFKQWGLLHKERRLSTVHVTCTSCCTPCGGHRGRGG